MRSGGATGTRFPSHAGVKCFASWQQGWLFVFFPPGVENQRVSFGPFVEGKSGPLRGMPLGGPCAHVENACRLQLVHHIRPQHNKPIDTNKIKRAQDTRDGS